MRALHEELTVRMQGTLRLLRFNRCVPCIDASENSPLCGTVAPEDVLTRAHMRQVAIVTIRAERAHTHSKEILVGNGNKDAETVNSC